MLCSPTYTHITHSYAQGHFRTCPLEEGGRTRDITITRWSLYILNYNISLSCNCPQGSDLIIKLAFSNYLKNVMSYSENYFAILIFQILLLLFFIGLLLQNCQILQPFLHYFINLFSIFSPKSLGQKSWNVTMMSWDIFCPMRKV